MDPMRVLARPILRTSYELRNKLPLSAKQPSTPRRVVQDQPLTIGDEGFQSWKNVSRDGPLVRVHGVSAAARTVRIALVSDIHGNQRRSTQPLADED
jgi:hypothetical protein